MSNSTQLFTVETYALTSGGIPRKRKVKVGARLYKECLPPVNIESGFFYYKLPQNMAGMDVFRDKLSAYKRASFYSPLQSNYALVVTNYIRSYHDQPSPGTRELPSLIQQGTCLSWCWKHPCRSATRGGLRFGQALWLSRIYLNLSLIKLFQESLFPGEPYLGAFLGDIQYAEWFPGARLAANEAYAYDRMRAIQGRMISSTILCIKWSFSLYVGRSVPWSYGFCKVFLISWC